MDLNKSPRWFRRAIDEIGTREVGDNRGAAIQRYCDLAHCGEQGDPWCAIFANAMLESVGVIGTRSASSQSFTHSDRFKKLHAAVLGCIVVFWRGSRDSGLGHVGFYRGETETTVCVLGGNEQDMVQIEPYPKVAGRFGLIGFYWPLVVEAAAYEQGPIIMPSAAASHVTDPTKVV